MLNIERQMEIDREEKRFETLKAVDGIGWSFANDRLEIAKLRKKHAERRLNIEA